MPIHPLEEASPYKTGSYGYDRADQERKAHDAAVAVATILAMNAEAAAEILAAVENGDYAEACRIFESGRMNTMHRNAAMQGLRESTSLIANHLDKEDK